MAKDRQLAERAARLEEECEDEEALVVSNIQEMEAGCREDEREIEKVKA